MFTAIGNQIRTRVLSRLGLESAPVADLDGLRAVYAAWCVSVPFDNIAKLIALRTASNTPLPGMDPSEFFERWLDHGVGGTCWATANSLCELLLAIGFNARRVAGSMRDTGYIGHGSVKVRIEKIDWLVDSSMLTDVPLPLTNEVFIASNSVYGAEAEPANGSHIVWADLPPNPTLIPCRLLMDPATPEFYVERYEASRLRSPFNERLYIRRNRPGARLVLDANTRIHKSAQAQHTDDLNRDGLCECLINEFNISSEMVDAWIRSGALDASFAQPSTPTPAAITRLHPSARNRPLNFR